MINNKNEKDLIQQIKQLPKIEDKTKKEILFENISAEMKNRRASVPSRVKSRRSRKSKRKHAFIPVFSTALVIAILLLMLPSILNKNNDQLANQPVNDQEDMAESNKNTNNGMDDNNYEPKSDTEEYIEQNQADSTSDQNEDRDDEAYPVFAAYTDPNLQIVYGAVADPQLQYFIPISVIIPESENIENFYNSLGDFINSEEWGVSKYPFEDVTFDINFDEKEVIMNLPDDFSVGEGSAGERMINQVLAHMFLPYDISKISFNGEVYLGSHIGTITETNLYEQQEHYKIFQANENTREFLIPIIQAEQLTITEAFEDMKNAEEAYNVYPTISSEVDVTLEANSTNLVVTFTDDTELAGSHKNVTMLEAMLMTAKSYGFETVTFEANVDRVGPYDMHQAIQVPDAVNPVN